MGKTTELGRDRLCGQFNPTDMAAVVTVKSPGQPLIQKAGIFVYKSGDHVETGMMQWLYTQFYGFNFPGDTTIIFTCNWSPCKTCTEKTIKGWLDLVRLAERPLRIKFRFRKYYSKQEYGGAGSAAYVWSSNSEANQAYAELCSQYGNYGTRYEHSDAAEGMTRVTEFHKPKLVIQRLGTGRTSQMGSSFEGMLV